MKVFISWSGEPSRSIALESAAAEVTNYFVVQGAVLLASIRLWAQLSEKTEAEAGNDRIVGQSSLEKVVEDLAGSGDPEGLMASQLLQAIVNRPQPFVAEARHWASSAFADGGGERRSTDPYDRPVPVLWSCPDPNCPPTAIAPVDVPESGEDAGSESERFTTDEVAALLNVRLTPSTSGTEGAWQMCAARIREAHNRDSGHIHGSGSWGNSPTRCSCRMGIEPDASGCVCSVASSTCLAWRF